MHKTPACALRRWPASAERFRGDSDSVGGFARLACWRSFFTRSQHHDHLASFQLGHGLDLAEFNQIVAYAFQYPHTQFLVSHFAATEAQGHLGFIAFLDEAAQIAQLDLIVAFVGTRTELDFLDLDDLLFGARLV